MKYFKKVLAVITVALIVASLSMSYLNLTMKFCYIRKCMGSGFVALLGALILVYSLIAKRSCIRFYVTMALGLALACIGDIFIDKHFILGAAAFAMGHICFGAAYCFLQPIKRLDCIFSGILFAGCLCLLLLMPFIVFDNTVLQVVCIIYALIISFMLGKAVGNFVRNRNTVTATLVLASAVFFFSDLMLVFDQFANVGSWASTFCLASYYPALCLLALSAYFNAIKST